MSSVFADSFYFIALFNRNDAAHSAAVKFATTARCEYVTTDWVLTEVADACAHPSKRPHFLQLMEVLRQSPDTTVVRSHPELFNRGVEMFSERPDKHWSLTDCLSFVVMQEHGLTDALTGDRHFEQAGFKALLKS